MLFMTNKRILEVFYVLFYVHKNIYDYYTYIVCILHHTYIIRILYVYEIYKFVL